MQGMKSAFVFTAILAAIALGACRSEVPTPPLKLGADVPAAQKVISLKSGGAGEHHRR
jgi:hypothetical protein